jgi:hypothetical protein
MIIPSRVARFLAPMLVTLVACTGRDVTIEVVIPGPDSVEAPVPGIGLVALPYDRDSVIRELERATPRPAALTRELDSLFQVFRGPFMAYAAVAFRTRAFERSLAEIRARLDTIPRASPGYDSLYRVFAARTDTLTRLVRERDEAQAILGRTRNSLGDRIDSLRAAMSRWQDSAYREYESITKNLTSGLGREPVADSTGPDGRATLHLPVGDWWIYARSWDPWDPNAEWYWNVPARGSRIVLDSSSGRRTPRY